MTIYQPAAIPNVSRFSSDLLIAASCLALAIAWIAPLVAYVVIFTSGFLCRQAHNAYARRLFMFACIVASSLMVASASRFETNSDDFIRYYELYQRLFVGDYEAIATYRGGIELGLPLVYIVLSATGLSAPSFVLFAQTLVLLTLFCVWLERQEIIRGEHGVLIAGCALFFFSIGHANQLTRQMYSSVLLLFAVTAKSKTGKVGALILATTFHITALGVFVLVRLAKRIRYKSALLIGVVVLPFAVFFPIIVRAILESSLPGWIRYSSFVQAYREVDFTNLTIPLRLLATLAALSLFVAVRELKLRRSKEHETDALSWAGPLVLSMTVIVLALLPVPLAPLRVSLIVSEVMIGYLLASFFVKNWPAKYLAIAMIAYSLYRAFSVSETFGQTSYWYTYNAVLQYPGQFIEVWLR